MLEGRVWYSYEGASARTLEALRAAAPSGLPDTDLQLLSASNGGEGPLPVNPFNLCLHPAEEVIVRLGHGNYQQTDFEGFLVFGGNGGGEYLAFDMRSAEPWPVITIDMVAGSSSAEVVSPNFGEFLDLIGVEQLAG